MKGARLVAGAFVAAVALLLIGAALWLLDDPPTLVPVAPRTAEVSAADAAREGRVRRGEAAPDVVALVGARIVGIVADADGAPVTDADVTLWTRGVDAATPYDDEYGAIREDDGPALPAPDSLGAEVGSTTTGADGVFSFGGVMPGELVVMAAGPSGRSASRALLLPAGLPELRADLRLTTGAWGLDVRVVRADGRPFAGRVGVEPDPAFTSAPGVRWRAVDAGGRARFSGVPFRRLRLVASGTDGRHERSNALDLPHDGAYVWTLGLGLTDVRGTVRDLDSSAPISGALVRVRDARGTRAARTDDAGTFTVGGATTGTLRVTADSYGAAVASFGEEREVELLLAGSGTVTGRVTRLSDDSPVEGTTVWAGDWLDADTPHAITAADGTYTVSGVPPGKAWMRVHGDGWVTAEEHGRASWRAAEVHTDGAATCDLVAMQTGRLEGRVVDPDGRGVAGAYVGVGERDHGHTQDMRDVATITDADGYFAIDGIFRANQPKYVCRADGFPTARGDAPRVYAGNTRTLEITLSAPLRLDVRVVTDGAGAPVAGALVSIRRVEPGLGHHHVATGATDADGSVRVGPLAPGRHWVNVVAAGMAEAERLTAVDVENDGQQVVVRLLPELRVSGTVLRDGAPAPFVAVHLMRDGLPDTLRTGPDGTFSFGRLPPGPVGLRAVVDNLEASERVDAGQTGVRLELVPVEPKSAANSDARRARIEVRAPDGAPLPGFKWKVVQARVGTWQSFWDIGRDGGGEYEVRDDLPTRTLIVWEARDAASRRLPVHVVSTRLPDGPPDVFTFTLPTTTPAITGRVVDDAGAIVGGGFVHAVHGGSDRATDVRRETIARFPVDANGAFRVEGFGADSVRLVAVPPRSFTLSPYVDAAPGDGDVELRVRAAARAVITIVDDAGAPVPGTTVYVEDEFDFDRQERPRMGVDGFSDDIVAHGRTGPDGRVVLERLDPSFELGLRVYPPGREYIADFDDDEPWVPEDTTIVLRSKGVITGTVRLADGRPAGSAMIYIRKGSRASGSGVASDGSFRLTGMAAGVRAEVFAELPGGARSEVVEAGTDAPVALTIDPGPHVTLRVVNYEPGMMASVRLAPNPYGRHETPRLQDEIVLSNLDPDVAYTVLLGPDDDGRCALLESVVADGSTRDVQLVQGEPLEGSLSPPAGPPVALRVELARDGHMLAKGRLRFRAGRPSGFAFAGVPPGPWTLLVRNRFDDDAIVLRREVTVPLQPGEMIDLAW